MPIGKPKRHYRDKDNPTKWQQVVPKPEPKKEPPKEKGGGFFGKGKKK